METIFNAKEIQAKWYKKWIEEKAFESSGDTSKEPYSIPIPPPNVTGMLHIGHSLNLSIQDAMIRRKRMQGFDALWIPGTDHAGIATQAKVEERLLKNGKTRHEIGREKFLEEAWKWKEEFLLNIHSQWEAMGISVDYSKERFTLDEGLSKSVRKVFVALYQKGLIYQGTRIINWDPVFKTALSDIEVETKKEERELFYLKYLLEDGTGFISVATSRPETIFGDAAIAVHPEDTRYSSLIGKNVIVPISGHIIPIISDEYPKAEFGSGAVKVTPAHDANDFDIGKRHQLKEISVLNEDATLNHHAGIYENLDRFSAREKIIHDLTEKELLIKSETYETEIGYSERSKAEIEPRLSQQWFVKMDSLSKQALELQNTDDKIEFFPKEAEDKYIRWISNVHDWCISRQLWWGHRIPVWHCTSCGKNSVSETDLTHCSHCSSSAISQDEDVLDTWFSSGLWAFSTLDWIEESPLFKRYYPADALVTASDIIFFWVSRMIFTSLEFTEKKPFKHVLLHGLVLDEFGEKQSKSKGNGIDPLEVIEEFGTDSLRFMLLTSSTLGSNIRYSKEKLESAQAFGIKLWNASRYILMNKPDGFTYSYVTDTSILSPADKWILSRLNNLIKESNESFEHYDFHKVGNAIRSFFFDDFCGEYIELTKDMSDEEKKTSFNVLIYTLDKTLRLLHPFMPFLTEEIWSNLNIESGLLMLKEYPAFDENLSFPKEEKVINELISLIREVRTLRQESGSKTPLPMMIKSENDTLSQYEKNIRRRCKINLLFFNLTENFFGKTLTLYSENTEIQLPFLGLYDISAEKERLKKELTKWDSEVKRCMSLLEKESFISRAKDEIIQKEKEKLALYRENYEKTKKLLTEIENI